MIRSLCRACCLALLPIVGLSSQAVARPKAKAAARSAALPRKAPPQGMLEVAAGGTGRILTSRMSGTRSARKMLMALRIGIGGYFDARPSLTSAFADRADQNLQAAFTARLGGVPVRGVIAIQMQGATGQATMLFDRAASFRQSFARLTQRVNVAPAPGKRPAPVRLTMTPLLDGSGQIGLPPGWQVTGSYKGTVDAAGPDGASLGLGGYAVVASPQTGGYTGLPMADFNDPVRAALDYAAFQSNQARMRGLPESRVTRVIDSKPIEWGNGHAAFIRFSAILNGKPVEGLGLYAITPIDETQAMLYYSVALAPTQAFNKRLPEMWAAWQSWGVKDEVLRERMTSALNSMRATGDILTGANASREESYAHVNKAWDQYIRDESTWSNPNTGKRYTLPNSALPPTGNMGPLVPVPLGQL